MVGREEELTRLEDALLAACRGAGSVMIVAGDAGLGKSRLAGEVMQRADRIGAEVMEGSCSEAELALPYLPFLEAIGNHLEATDLGRLRERLEPSATAELGHLFPRLGTASGPVSDSDSSQARMRLYEAILALLRTAAEEKGLLLVIEDIHWADASTRELLDYIARRLRNSRILLLATYRRDELHRKHPLLPTIQGWQRSRLAELIELEALDPHQVAKMVSGILDDTAVGEEFRDFLHARTEGNPFVLEEMLKAALDRGDVYHDRTDWQRKPLTEFGIPPTVRDTILLRAERLAPEQLDVLRMAAILGRSFEPALLAEVSERNRTEVEGALEVFEAQQLVEADPGRPGRHRFRHALTQEAVYESISPLKRERLHSAAADALLRRSARAIDITEHLFLANRAVEAVPLCLQAANEAEAGYANRDAAELRARALPFVTEGRAELVGRIGDAYLTAGDALAAHGYLEEAVEEHERKGDVAQSARVRLLLGRSLWEQHRHRLAEEQFEKARAVLEPLGPSRDLAFAYMRLAGINAVNYRAQEAVPLADRAIAMAEEVGADDIRIWTYNFKGTALAWQGQLRESVDLLERSHREAVERGFHYIAQNALFNLTGMKFGIGDGLAVGQLLTMALALPPSLWRERAVPWFDAIEAWAGGDLERALVRSRELVEIGRQSGNRWLEESTLTWVAAILGDLGRLEEATAISRYPDPTDGLQVASQWAWSWIPLRIEAGDLEAAGAAAAALAKDPEVIMWMQEMLDPLIWGLVAGGRLEQAGLFESAAEGNPATAGNPFIDLPRARIALAGGRSSRAVELARQSADRYRDWGYRVFEARSRLLLGEALIATGDRPAAEVELRRTAELAQVTGAALIGRHVNALLESLGVAEEYRSPEPAAAPVALGEKLVTVLFADVRGYTAMSGEAQPSDLVDRLAAYQRWTAQEVARHRGTVDKFAGDAVMATFNISGAEVDHTLHALRAAMAIRDKAAAGGLPVGIGIATGAAVVGRLAEGSNVSVIGQTTNLAARLQALARAGEIVLSDEAFRRVHGWLGEQGLAAQPETVELKGFETSVAVHRLGPSAD
ncbi:MAG: helix-turn-helix transcriptional regulator [Candidatus Dormibacteraceae bacterium]